MAHGSNVACFCMSLGLRVIVTFLKKYVAETLYGPQSLKYLQSGPLQEKFAGE